MQIRYFLASASILFAATGCCGFAYDASCLETPYLETPPVEEHLPLAPIPRFHPVPTRPVFSPATHAETPMPAPAAGQFGPAPPLEEIPSVVSPQPAVELLAPPEEPSSQASPQPAVELLAPPEEPSLLPKQQGDSAMEKVAPRTAALPGGSRTWLRR